MNVGFIEAEALVGTLKKILREDAPSALLDTHQREQQAEWQRLLGLTGGLQARQNTDPWVAARRGRILSCLPGSNGELIKLANQLRLDLT